MAFAQDPEHYDFGSDRCVKDLVFGSRAADDVGGTLVLELAPNEFKHSAGLTLAYDGVVSVALDRDRYPEVGWLGTVLLDELLPAPNGVAHEILFTGGALQVVAADVRATWGDATELPWQPLFAVSASTWVGLVDGQWWAGSSSRAKQQIDRTMPIALLPLLELPLEEALARLQTVDAALVSPEAPMPTVEAIVDTAVKSEMPYWVDRAMDWMETQPALANDTTLRAVAESSWASQRARQKASRLARARNPVPIHGPKVRELLAVIVARGGEARSSYLAENCDLTKAQLKRQLDWMEKQDLINQVHSRNGTTRVRATESGRATLKPAVP